MILLTGANGFLGKEIRAHFNKIKLEYLTIGRSTCSDIPWNMADKSFEIPPVVTIVHIAGKAHVVPRTEAEKNDFFTVNVTGTQNLLSCLENTPSIKKFIFISSVSVYGLVEGSGITENSPLLATDPYGQSKIAAEKLVIDWCTKRNIIYYILRLPLVAGKNAPGNLGAMVKGINKGRYMSIGKAAAKKSMVLANDLAGFITTLDGPSGIYNLCDGYHPSFKELEHNIASFYKKRDPFSLPKSAASMLGFAGDLMGDRFPVNSYKLSKITSTLTFDDSKARLALQWSPREVLKHWDIE